MLNGKSTIKTESQRAQKLKGLSSGRTTIWNKGHIVFDETGRKKKKIWNLSPNALLCYSVQSLASEKREVTRWKRTKPKQHTKITGGAMQ